MLASRQQDKHAECFPDRPFMPALLRDADLAPTNPSNMVPLLITSELVFPSIGSLNLSQASQACGPQRLQATGATLRNLLE